MSHFVLVHGAWCGGWVWERVRTRLESRGHTVTAPTLTGLGDKAAEAGPETGLATHISDIEQTLHGLDGHDIILVGHSYSGMAVTGVLSGRESERIHRAILIDSYVPKPGQRAFDLMPSLEAAMAPIVGKAWATAPLDFASAGVTDTDDLRWLRAHVTDLPLLTHAEPLPTVNEPDWQRFSTRYLLCTAPLLFEEMAQDAASRGLTVEEFDSGHMPMVTAPDRLVAALESSPAAQG